MFASLFILSISSIEEKLICKDLIVSGEIRYALTESRLDLFRGSAREVRPMGDIKVAL